MRQTATPMPSAISPTTLPTWDEMLAWDGMTPDALVPETVKRLDKHRLNVLTVHAEVEGSVYFPRFHQLIEEAPDEGVEWVFLPQVARELLNDRARVPCDTMTQGTLPGRAGTVTMQGTGDRGQGTGVQHLAFAVPRSQFPDS